MMMGVLSLGISLSTIPHLTLSRSRFVSYDSLLYEPLQLVLVLYHQERLQQRKGYEPCYVYELCITKKSSHVISNNKHEECLLVR